MVSWHTSTDNGFVLLKTGDLYSRVSQILILSYFFFSALVYVTITKRAELTKIRFPEGRVQDNDVFYSKSVQQRLNKT